MAAIKAQGKPSIADQAKGAFGKKRSLDDIEEDLFVRAPMKKFATDLATNLAQKAPKMAQQYSQSEQSKHRQQQPRLASVVQQAQAAHKKAPAPRPQIPASSKWNTVKKPSVMEEIKKLGKKRSLEYDEELFERTPMKKFATDLATNLAQKAPKMAQQYSQSEQAKHRQQQPRLASVVQQAQAANKAKTGPAPRPQIPASSKWNTDKKPSVMEEIKKLGKK
eukprot:TRINITY_DN19993_c0_g1_i1.p1 TRINITY_DN19993_c0_g1~~TRINITY_DN19993_c0_g1_i1.p1  ORF type:complete len:221 (+),score=45.66 TRINITY_DN19993_c0_g1_i1:2-664(+)